MIAPSGGLSACGTSGGNGVSPFTLRRTRIASPGLNRCAGSDASAGVDLPQRRDVVEDPDAAPVRADHEIVALDRRCRGTTSSAGSAAATASRRRRRTTRTCRSPCRRTAARPSSCRRGSRARSSRSADRWAGRSRSSSTSCRSRACGRGTACSRPPRGRSIADVRLAGVRVRRVDRRDVGARSSSADRECVTSSHVLPSSRVSLMRPLFVPTQITPRRHRGRRDRLDRTARRTTARPRPPRPPRRAAASGGGVTPLG